MSITKTNHVKMVGIAVTLPKNKASVHSYNKGHFETSEIETISKTVGVQTLYEATPNQTASDFCLNSAEKLIDDVGWSKDSIDGLIFASQTPDYIAPATSSIMQNRLGLSTDCITFDINFGCTGFLNGMLMASNFIELGTCKRVLVLVGDTLRRLSSEKDNSLHFILSDAGSAVAFEYTEECIPMSIAMHSDGSGYEGLMVPAGGARLPKSNETCIMKDVGNGNYRSDDNYLMDGMSIFTFAIKNAPKAINEIIDIHGWDKNSVDKYFLHQANAYMVKYITKRAKIDIDLCPINIDKYGNTNGTTIPLLLLDYFSDSNNDNAINAVLCAFGVGLSWGAVAVRLEKIICSEIQYI